MPEGSPPEARYTTPGVYVRELSHPPPAIQGAPTSLAAFVGLAPRGVLERPVPVGSMAEFQRGFGWGERNFPLRDALHLFFANGGGRASVVRIREGRGDEPLLRGLQALEGGIPSTSSPSPRLGMEREWVGEGWRAGLELCRRRRAILLLDPPPSWPAPADLLHPRTGWGAPGSPLPPPDLNGALYFPWLLLGGGGGRTPRVVPPSGAVAGVIARTDATRGVWKAPAGVEARVEGGVGLSPPLPETGLPSLVGVGVNPLRSLPSGEVVLWGARTSAGGNAGDPEWKYLPVRRLALFLEESLTRGTEWSVFEPNDHPLWLRLRSVAENFLDSLFRAGAFAGQTPTEAYFVQCGLQTTSQEEIRLGRVNLQVGFAPLKPREFTLLRIPVQGRRGDG